MFAVRNRFWTDAESEFQEASAGPGAPTNIIESERVAMHPRTGVFAVVTLCVALIGGCTDIEPDRPVSQPEPDARPEATEPAAPLPDATLPAAEPDGPSPDDAPEKPPAATVEQTTPSEDAVEDLEEVRKEIAALERDARFSEALARVHELSKTYRSRPEASELAVLRRRLYQQYHKASGLDFAIGKLGSGSTMAISVATGKLLDAGDVGLIFLRKAVREAEPKTAACAANILVQQDEPQVARLMVERMEQDPPEPLGDDLGKLLQQLDVIESEWIERLCSLAQRKGSSQAGAVDVLIDRVERSIRVQLETAKPEAVEPEAAQENENEQPGLTAIEVDERLPRALYEVALSAEGPLQRRAIGALVLVLEEVNRRDGKALNQLLDNEEAYSFLGDYVVACLQSEKPEDRLWAFARAASLEMKAAGLWAYIRLDQPDDAPVLDERLDPALHFTDLATLCKTGPVEQGQTIRWEGFLDVPAEGDYTFSVDCAETSPTTFFVDEKPTAVDEPVKLSAGWHEVQAVMNLPGDGASTDQPRLDVFWEGPDLNKQSIPAERLACADRTRMLIWWLGRECDLPRANELTDQLIYSLERVDEELAGKLMAVAETDRPARPAIAALLAELLDYSIAHAEPPPEWETQLLALLLDVSDQITGARQQRVVASLVNHLVRRAGGDTAKFDTQAESPDAYRYIRAFIAERLDDEQPEVAGWAMQHAGAVQLALQGLWAKTYANREPAEGDTPLDERLNGSMNFPDLASLRLGLAKRICWEGYLNVPFQGEYTFSIDSNKQAAIRLGGNAVEPGKPLELPAGMQPMVVELRLTDAETKLVLSWKPPDKQEPEVIPSDRMICPDWPKVLTWEATERPLQAEPLAGRLALMVNRIDQPLAEDLLALIEPDGPAAMPAAEVLARALRNGHLDDTFEKTFPEQLWPLANKTEGQRQRVLIGALATTLPQLFANKAEDFDTAVKVEGASQTLRDFVAERLDAEETNVAAWATEHATQFGMGLSGLWIERLASPDGPPVLERHHSVELNLADLAAVIGAAKAKQGETIRWTGYLRCPSDGKYVFTIDAAQGSPVEMEVNAQPIQFGKPVELPAGLHAVDLRLAIGPDAKLVLNWQQPGKDQAELISRNSLACPAWVKLLVWQLQHDPDPQRSEEICSRLARMLDHIDQSLATDLLALIEPDGPSVMPVAELLARVLRNGHLDDNFERTIPEQLWPLAAKAEGQRQRVLMGTLVATLPQLFANKGEDFDTAVKVEGAFETLRDFVAERLDAKEADAAAWAMENAAQFGLGLSGLWIERLTTPDGAAVLERHHGSELNLADLAAVTATAQARQGETIRWTGYLKCPSDGAYVFTIDAGRASPVKIEVAGLTIQSGKPVELAAGPHAMEVWLTIGPDAKFVVNWHRPGTDQVEVLNQNYLACPAWTKLLVWQLQQGPDAPQSEEICSRLARTVDRIDQTLTEDLLPLIEPDNPSAMPVAEVLARVLRKGRLDDTFEKTLPEQLWPLVDKADGERRRVVIGALIEAIGRLFANSGPEFDKAVKVDGVFQTLRDFVAARIDAEEPNLAAWATEHAAPFGLGLPGLWIERLTTPDGPPMRERHHGVELNLADLAAVTSAAQASVGETIRWTGYLKCPIDGPYVFAIDAAKGSPVEMQVAGQTIQSGKPVELTAGLHAVDLRLTIGPDAKLVLNWQQPGNDQAELLSRNSLTCPAWEKLLVWQLQHDPDFQQSEEISSRLGRMVDRIDQPLAEDLLALVKADGPSAMSAAEVLARVLRNGHLDDTFEKTLPEHLWPLVAKADDRQQRVLVGALITTLPQLFANKVEDFDKAVKVPGASATLRDFVAERLDAKELPVRLWAAEHAEPFSLLGSGLEGSYFDAGFKARLFDRLTTTMQIEPGQFGYPDDRNDNMGIRWSGLIKVPADGDYTFSSVVDDTCRLWLDGQPVIDDSKKPGTVKLTAGLHEVRIEFVETTGPERLVVYWQTPGQSQPQVLAGELKHVDLVQLLVYKLTRRPDDPEAESWLQSLRFKADRLAAEPIDELAKLAEKRASWQAPLAGVAAAAITRDPGKAPAPAALLLSKSVADLQDAGRRQAIEALAAYFPAACGSDKAKFQQAVGSDKTYDFLCAEVQSAADSAEPADVEWAQQQAALLAFELGTTVRQAKDGRVLMMAKTATLHGDAIKYEVGEGKDNIGSWTKTEDFASWRLAVEQGGTFAVSLTWSCTDGSEDGEFVVATGGQELSGTIAATGDWTKFQTIELGNVTLAAGIHELTVKPKAIPKGALMNLKSISIAR